MSKHLGVMVASLACVALLACGGLACGGLQMGAAVEKLNSAAPKGEPPPSRTPTERVARLTEQHLSDAYFRPTVVGAWLEALARAPQPLTTLIDCINDARKLGKSAAICHTTFSLPGAANAAWGLPQARPTTEVQTYEAAQTERDAQRWLGNLRALAAALSELTQAYGGARVACEEGIAAGARKSAAYLATRRWDRGPTPPTALVLGGGSANGAFGAGFAWRLLDVLEQCKHAPNGGCGDARIDLVVGTSTGTLIGALVDLYFTKGHEQEAMQQLVDNYTCSVEADLYCAPDEYVWKLFQDARGIVRFNGIASKIDRYITREVEQNALELVGVTVDLRYGEVLGFSDQDPADATAGCGRRDALLASIVLPVMAEPVAAIDLRSGKREGPFVDGGVSSVVPMLEAVRRGAARAVVVSNYPMAPEPVPMPRNAFDVLLRSLTLAMLNPGPNEMQHGDLYARARRQIEQQICFERFEHWNAASSEPMAVEQSAAPAGAPPSAAPTSAPPAVAPTASQFCQLGEDDIDRFTSSLPHPVGSDAFRSAWVFRTEGTKSERGYAFDPKAMRELFLLGVSAFQERCHEVLDVLGITGEVAKGACSATDATGRPKFRDIGQCKSREIKECEGPIVCKAR